MKPYVALPMMVFMVAASAPQRSEIERNKAVVLKSEAQLWSKGNLAVADQLYSSNFICHFVVGPDWRGIDGIKNEVRNHRIAFPD